MMGELKLPEGESRGVNEKTTEIQMKREYLLLLLLLLLLLCNDDGMLEME